MIGCKVYWGSHGCCYHDAAGRHRCDCCECPEPTIPWGQPGNEGLTDEPNDGCVGHWPYYGEDRTEFYGDDAADAPTRPLT